MKNEKSLSVSVFKAKALTEIERVRRTGEAITLTKRGKAIARVVPLENERKIDRLELGRLRSTLIEQGDLITPFGAEIWEAAQGEPSE